MLLVGLAAVILGLSLARAVTFDAWADGSAIDHGRGAVLALGIALAAWVGIRATIPERPAAWVALPWLTAILVLTPSYVVHHQRIGHPVARAGALVIEDDFEADGAPDPAKWIVEVRGQGAAIPGDGAVVLTSEPGSAAFLDLVTPGRPDPNALEVWLPRGLYTDEYDEVLEWEASVTPHAAFSVMLETRQLLVQATAYGLHISYPNLERRITEHHMELPELKDGQVRDFRLERTSGLIRLRVNDEPGWVYPDAGRFETVRFGETRPDPLHAGTLRLDRARYERHYKRG